MSEPEKVTRSGDVLRDENGAYATCPGCGSRVKMTSKDDLDEISGTCKTCGYELNADKECIWGVNPGNGKAEVEE